MPTTFTYRNKSGHMERCLAGSQRTGAYQRDLQTNQQGRPRNCRACGDQVFMSLPHWCVHVIYEKVSLEQRFCYPRIYGYSQDSHYSLVAPGLKCPRYCADNYSRCRKRCPLRRGNGTKSTPGSCIQRRETRKFTCSHIRLALKLNTAVRGSSCYYN